MKIKLALYVLFALINFNFLAQPCNMSLSTGVNNAMGGGPNGTINLTVNGGTAPYSFIWSNGSTTQNLNMLPQGCYTVVVNDAAGCQAMATACVTNLAGPILYSNSNVVSFYQAVNGGFTPQWVCQNDTLYSDGGIMKIYLESGATMITGGGIDTIYAKTGATIVMNGGIHRIYHEPGVNLVMNGGIPYLYLCPSLVFNYSQAPANGCVPVPVCNITATASVTNVSCAGIASGSATLTATGGTAPFSYVWSPNAANTQTANNLVAGTYTVTITDANGCTADQSVTITEPSSIAMSTAITNIQCFGQNEGVSMVTASGGNAPYNLTYSGPISGNPPGNDILVSGGTFNINNLAPGSYSVNLTDANGCVVTQNFTITQPSQLTVATSTTDELLGSDGTFSATISGGMAPYNISWTGPVNANPVGNEILSSGGSYTANNLPSGTYNITITDDNGCTESTLVTVGSQVGVETLDKNNAFRLYPNPTVNLLNVQMGANTLVSEVYILSMEGRVVSTFIMDGNEIKVIDVASLSNGRYLVQFLGENGMHCETFVKQ